MQKGVAVMGLMISRAELGLAANGFLGAFTELSSQYAINKGDINKTDLVDVGTNFIPLKGLGGVIFKSFLDAVFDYQENKFKTILKGKEGDLITYELIFNMAATLTMQKYYDSLKPF